MDGEKRPVPQLASLTVLSVLGKIGCLTFLIALAALLGGLWLDSQLGTRPWLTVLLVGLSVPLVMVLTIKLTLSSTKHLSTSTPSQKLKRDDHKEENDREPSS
jgi:hypothetical protein